MSAADWDEPLKIGERVRTTERWKRNARPKQWPEYGTVVGISSDKLIRVRKDGNKAPRLYGSSYWERIQRPWRFTPERTPHLTALLDWVERHQPIWTPDSVAPHLRHLFGVHGGQG